MIQGQELMGGVGGAISEPRCHLRAMGLRAGRFVLCVCRSDAVHWPRRWRRQVFWACAFGIGECVMSQLSGKGAVVTGAWSGMGWATARELAGMGAAVVVSARRKEKLDQLVKEIGAAGG